MDLIRECAKFMRDKLKDCSYVAAGRIAKQVIDKYPKAFEFVTWDDSAAVDDGFDKLRTRIYDCARYKNRGSRISVSSAAAREENEENPDDPSSLPNRRHQMVTDSYGCVAYEPPLLEGETLEAQEIKKDFLKNAHRNNNQPEGAVAEMMELTYATQRVNINHRSKEGIDMKILLSDHWPYLTQSVHFLNHSNVLTGKDVAKVWQDNLEVRVKKISKVIEVECLAKKDKKGCGEYVNKCLEELKKAKNEAEKLQSEVPKLLVIFPLLSAYFGEKSIFELAVSIFLIRFFLKTNDRIILKKTFKHIFFFLSQIL